jgi:serine/threonine protein kinase
LSDQAQTEPIPQPQVIAGRYQLEEPIGRGGRSVVYGAHDPLLHRDVAVKVFRASAGSPGELQIQEAEARLAAGMNHHALTTLFDAGIDTTDPDNPQVYLVMERIPGMDLRRHLKQDGPLTAAQLAYLGFDLAEGLQFVHEHGFLHRDIKPANVLIADRRLETRVRGKLADFGIASIIGLPDDGEYTTGTIAYLSPEQVDGQAPTTASDIYALGLVLLEALTGQVAYPGTIKESAYARLDHDPQIPETVPLALSAILRGMTALLPADRPSLAEVALEFQRALVRDLVEAGRVDLDRLASNEEHRLAAVRRYNILDTPPDDAFDRITHLVCRTLDVPVAFISVIDVDREWFKSRRGIELTEIDRNTALCAIVVKTGEPLVVEDVRQHPAYLKNSIIAGDPTLHAFAAVPMRTHGGHSIGTLCVFDRRVRRFTDDEVDDLTQFAAIAMRELDLRLASRRAVFTS